MPLTQTLPGAGHSAHPLPRIPRSSLRTFASFVTVGTAVWLASTLYVTHVDLDLARRVADLRAHNLTELDQWRAARIPELVTPLKGSVPDSLIREVTSANLALAETLVVRLPMAPADEARSARAREALDGTLQQLFASLEQVPDAPPIREARFTRDRLHGVEASLNVSALDHRRAIERLHTLRDSWSGRLVTALGHRETRN